MLEFVTIKNVQQSVGIWCKQLRKTEKMTQKQLADELAISPITISKLENGENATLETVLKVLQYFDEMNAVYQFVQNKTAQLNDNESLY